MRLTVIKDAQIVRTEPDLRLRSLFKSPVRAGDGVKGKADTPHEREAPEGLPQGKFSRFCAIWQGGKAKPQITALRLIEEKEHLPGSPASCLCAV